MSFFKNFNLSTRRRVEIRVEAVNIFNHVSLGNPDGGIGVPGNLNPECRPDHQCVRCVPAPELPVRVPLHFLA